MIKLNKTLYSVLCLIFGMCTLSGCIEEFKADIPTDDSNLLVVEGNIVSSRENTFILSRTMPINSFNTPIETGAIVSVRGTDGSEYNAQFSDGQYTCMVGDLDPDEEYYLSSGSSLIRSSSSSVARKMSKNESYIFPATCRPQQ